MPSTYTERYIAAVAKTLPPQTQDDVRVELQASIADAVDARIDQGDDPADAERAVLADLGDPAALAAGYADRPLHLIGPRYYLTWLRLLKLLLWIVPICVAGAVALGTTISNAPIGEIIGQTVSVGISVIVHLVFWTTLVFAVLERTGADTGAVWNVDMLAEPEASGSGRSDAIASIVMVVILAGAIVWDRLRGFVLADGEALPILNPDLWPWWVAGLFALLAAEAVLAVVVWARGRWSVGAAIVNTALAVLFVSWGLTLLVRGELVNPEFLAFVVEAGGDGFAAGDAGAAEQGGVLRILAVLTGFVIVGISAWDAIDGWRKTRRAARA
ncbi:permease prefix domain 1-containing protein [Microbacterium sp. GXF6406]